MDEDQREIVMGLLSEAGKSIEAQCTELCLGDCCLNKVEKRAVVAALRKAVKDG